MPSSNPNLVPTVITDVNGKVTTVHKKWAEATFAMKLPAPTLSITPTNKDRHESITKVLGPLGMDTKPSRTRMYFHCATPDELRILDEALEGFDQASIQEKNVIAAALYPLSTDYATAETTHEIIVLRNAFTHIEQSVLYAVPASLILGLREECETPLDLSDPEENKKIEALLRFAFELKARAPHGGFLPVYLEPSKIGRIQKYDDPELVKLIRDNPERVDELIQFSIDMKSCDPDRLALMLQNDGPKSLSSGLL